MEQVVSCFAMKLSEGHNVRDTQSEVYRSQSTPCLPKRGYCFKSRSECVTEKLSVCCCNENGQAKDHVKNFVMIVSGGLKREIDSVKAVGWKEVGGVGSPT